MQNLQIVGILNVTPDSYFDGGKFNNVDTALAQAKKMIDEGANIIEIGGESTGPNAPDVSADDELQRVIPIIRSLRSSFPNTPLSIDTYKSAVAKAAIDEGVMMVNDVTAGRSDSSLFRTVADSEALLVLMYAKDLSARTTIEKTQYDDVIRTIADFLSERKKAAIDSGIDASRIILDPGMGHFVSSDAQYSFEIIRRLHELASLGSPLLLSPSRKSFLSGARNLSPADRLFGTIAASAIAVLNGATYIRTHDVQAVREGCETALTIGRI